ncbi:MAG: carbohydrate ABC transporter permease [Firmicutes bacterium]|nr:carbohydrate ABC transporter permease [Bacillota bacterium]
MNDRREVGEWGIKSSPLTRVVWYIILFLLSVIAVVPVIWMLSTSFKPSQEIFAAGIRFIPRRATFSHFIRLWESFPIPRILYNTFIVATATTLAQTTISVLAGYGFARFRFPLREPLFYLCAATMFIPIQVIMVSNYLLMSAWDILNTFFAVVAPQMANAFGIFLMRQHLRTFPEELIEAARIDGANELRVLIQVVLPSLKSVIAAMAILFFVNGWNQYVWPSLVLTEPEQMTLPIWLRQFMHAEGGSEWGMLMAASSLGVIPALILYVLAHRQIMSTFASTGLKG